MEVSVGVPDLLWRTGQKIREAWYRWTAIRVVWLVGFAFFATLETDPTWSKVWWFLTGVFLGQELPDRRAWSKRKRK
jgi:hypothetical protein